VRAYLRSLDPGLSREMWILHSGSLANAFGNGVVFPYLLSGGFALVLERFIPPALRRTPVVIPA